MFCKSRGASNVTSTLRFLFRSLIGFVRFTAVSILAILIFKVCIEAATIPWDLLVILRSFAKQSGCRELLFCCSVCVCTKVSRLAH